MSNLYIGAHVTAPALSAFTVLGYDSRGRTRQLEVFSVSPANAIDTARILHSKTDWYSCHKTSEHFDMLHYVEPTLSDISAHSQSEDLRQAMCV